MGSPNILILQADQLGAHALPVYGNPVVKTPHIDFLATNGAVIEDAYCNFPLCAPSRFSMMSGQLCSRIGAYDNGAEFPSEIPTFAHYLRALGYRTCLSGKMHFIGADQLHGFAERLTSDIYPGDFIWTPDWDAGIQKDTNGPQLIEFTGGCDDSPQIAYDETVAESACRWLRDRAGEVDPFMLTVSFTHPHDPYVCPHEFWEMYDGAEIPMPECRTLPDAHSARLMAQYGIDPAAVTEDQVRNARRGYYGSISYLDAKVGNVLEALNASGRMDDTLVVLTADHGDMLGEKGLWMKKVFYENSLRVPLIFCAPGLIHPKRLAGQASLVDLLPTLLSFAGGKSSLIEPLDGDDLSAALTGSEGNLPNRTIRAEITCEGSPGVMVMLRKGPYKFVWSSVDPPQLFDLSTDPKETENRAGDPALSAIVANLAAEVAETWNIEDLEADIRRSQRRRKLVRDAHAKAGIKPDWDFHESAGDGSRWMRGTQSYNDWAYGTISGHRN